MAKIMTTVYLDADIHARLMTAAEALDVRAAVIVRKGLEKELPIWEARAAREMEGDGRPEETGKAGT